MTINDMHPTELIEHRLRQEVATRNKIASDNKNNTDNLTFGNGPKSFSSHGAAAKGVREYNDAKELRMLADDSSYYDDLMGEI